MTTEQGHSALRPYPAWTRDGTRPWHHRTHDRALADGRTVRVWLGSWRGLRRGACVDDGEVWSDVDTAIVQPRVYWTANALRASSWRHVEACPRLGWLGIAYLPADPRPATAAWPNWRHLAHADKNWTDLLPEYERIIALPDDELVALLEG